MPFEKVYSDGTGYGMPALTSTSGNCDISRSPFTDVPIDVPTPFGGAQIGGFRVRWAGLACCVVSYDVCIFLDEASQGGVDCTDPDCPVRRFDIGFNGPRFVFRSGCDHSFRITSGPSFETWGGTITKIRLYVRDLSDSDPSCGTDQQTKIKFCVDATEDTSAPATWTTVVT